MVNNQLRVNLVDGVFVAVYSLCLFLQMLNAGELTTDPVQ